MRRDDGTTTTGSAIAPVTIGLLSSVLPAGLLGLGVAGVVRPWPTGAPTAAVEQARFA